MSSKQRTIEELSFTIEREIHNKLVKLGKRYPDEEFINIKLETACYILAAIEVSNGWDISLVIDSALQRAVDHRALSVPDYESKYNIKFAVEEQT